jgi:hypothetical protein
MVNFYRHHYIILLESKVVPIVLEQKKGQKKSLSTKHAKFTEINIIMIK